MTVTGRLFMVIPPKRTHMTVDSHDHDQKRRTYGRSNCGRPAPPRKGRPERFRCGVAGLPDRTSRTDAFPEAGDAV